MLAIGAGINFTARNFADTAGVGSMRHNHRCNSTTPLIAATLAGNLDFIRILCKVGADPNLYSYQQQPSKANDVELGLSPLMAATSQNNPDAIQMLLRAGANPYLQALDVNSPGGGVHLPLVHAAKYGRTQALEMLLGKPYGAFKELP